ncbi:MAG: cysteine hydrolase family protein [bacterium]
MDPRQTALVLIGYQNDYFAANGILHAVIEESSRVTGVLSNTIDLVERLLSTNILIVSTPILFTPDYSELNEPVGILKTIKEVGAFKAGTKGSETIPELLRFGERIMEVPGKRGLNAFSNTELDTLLQKRGIKNVALAGVVTSICIDSTGRSAFERGYKVSILSNCTSGRTPFEQEFYCENIFPLYAEVISHVQLLRRLGIDV